MTGCRHTPPSLLDGHAALPDRSHVLVQGETNLPDQAQILISLQDQKDQTVVVQGLPLVKDGRFRSLLTLPDGLSGGAYLIRLSFSPTAFDWSKGLVLKSVGRKGEYLSGERVKRVGNVTILQRDLPLLIPTDKGGAT